MYVPTIDLTLMWESIPFILKGLPYTLLISIVAFILSHFLGMGLAILSYLPNKLLQGLLRLYISFFRGVPPLVFLFLLYFGLPYKLEALTAAILCFTIIDSAFIAEIYRGSINSLDKGQWDASYALGMSFPQVMRLIILPQAFRVSIPALGNVAMSLIKGSSLAAMITIPDIFQRAKIVGGRTFDFMSMYILVAIMYWLICLVIEYGQKRLEKRYQLPVG